MSEVHHETVFFAGHVQGVGFRYTALQAAREFEVAGYVSNLSDGRVQIEVEGAASEVDAFVASVQEKMHGHVRNVDRHSSLRTAQFSGFSIR
jgi:acylphosphatase